MIIINTDTYLHSAFFGVTLIVLEYKHDSNMSEQLNVSIGLSSSE